MNDGLFDPFLDPDAKALANKMAAFLKSKGGELLDPVGQSCRKAFVWCTQKQKCMYFRGK